MRSAEGRMGAYIDGGDDDPEANLADSAGAADFEVEPEMEVQAPSPAPTPTPTPAPTPTP